MVNLHYDFVGCLTLENVRRITNPIRYKWFDIGIELNIHPDTLEVPVHTSCFQWCGYVGASTRHDESYVQLAHAKHSQKSMHSLTSASTKSARWTHTQLISHMVFSADLQK